jgi:hypothetical protein
MLKPLSEWICDACGEIIREAKEGYIEWQKADGKKYGFRIVHHALYSPRRDGGGNCYYRSSERGGDKSLAEVVGSPGLSVVTSWLDVGAWHEDSYSGPSVRDVREWVTLFRRLYLPYFEEARCYHEELQGLIDDGVNEYYLYLPETLRHVIEKHESE